MQNFEFYRLLDEILPGGDYENTKNYPNRKIYFARISIDGLKEMHNYSTDERLYEYFEFETFKTIEDTRDYLGNLIALEGVEPVGRTAMCWFIRRIDDNRMVGTARLVEIDYNRQSVVWGYGIDPELWGEGYIFEIQEVLKEYIFEKLQLNRLSGMTQYNNERTKAALKAAGCKNEGLLRDYYKNSNGEYIDAWIYGMLAEDHYSSATSSKNYSRVITIDVIKNIVGNVLNQMNIGNNDSMSTVSQWDSLNHINIILEIEKKTEFKFSPLQISNATSIEGIYKIINGL